MIRSFHPILERSPLAPAIDAVDLRDVGATAGHGARVVDVLRRIDDLGERLGEMFVNEAAAACAKAFGDGLAAARKATAWSHSARSSGAALAERQPDVEVLREHMRQAEPGANELLRRRCSTMRAVTTRELAGLLGGWRSALDQAGRVDPAELEKAEQAYAAAAAIDINAAWPRLRFVESTVTPSEHA